jgi:uncharacterized protein YcgI (DUF1989 family)
MTASYVTRDEMAARLGTIEVKLDGLKVTQGETLREVRTTNNAVGDLNSWRAVHTQEHSNRTAFHDGQVLVVSAAWKVVIVIGALMAMLATGANLWTALG